MSITTLVNSKYYLNIRSGYMAPVTLHCSYGDSGETITFYILDGGEDFDLAGSVVSVHGTRIDGANFGPFGCTVNGNSVSFKLQSSMTAVEGSGIAEFVITKPDGTIGTCNFGILVEKAAFPNSVSYDTDPSVYQDILKYVQTIPSSVVTDYTSKIAALSASVNSSLQTERQARAAGDSANADAINTQKNRIDNFIKSGTSTETTELVDLRATDDGRSFSTAGDAIRTRFEDVSMDAVNVGRVLGGYAYENKVLNTSFEQGSLNNDGSDMATQIRIRSSYIYTVGATGIKLSPVSGYKAYVQWFDQNKQSISYSDFASTSTVVSIPENSYFVRIVIGKTDNTTIPVGDYTKVDVYLVNGYNSSRALANAVAGANGELEYADLYFRYGSVIQPGVKHRICTDFIRVDPPFEVFFNTFDSSNLLELKVNLYDGDLNDLGDAFTTDRVVHAIIPKTDAFKDAKFARVYCRYAGDSSHEINSTQLNTANRNCKIRFKPYVKDQDIFVSTDSYVKATDDFESATSTNANFNDYYYSNKWVESRAFYKSSAYTTLVNCRNAYEAFNYVFYLRYFNKKFEYISTSQVIGRGVANVDQSKGEYFKISVGRADGTDFENVTQKVASVDQLASNYTLKYGSMNMSGYTYPGTLRLITCNPIYIKDGYIELTDKDTYEFSAMIMNMTTDRPIADSGWISGGFWSIDGKYRVSDNYVHIIIRKKDNSEITYSELHELNRDLPYKIVDSTPDYKNGYPSYYNDEMKATINTLTYNINPNGITFAMITDLHDNSLDHIPVATQYQFKAIRYLSETCKLDFAVCGGDITDGGYTSKDVLLEKFMDQSKLYSSIKAPVFVLRGNHDDNSYMISGDLTKLTPANVVSRPEFYTRFISQADGIKVAEELTYYYRDFPDLGYRVICLDFIDYPWVVQSDGTLQYAASGDRVWRGYSDKQIKWFLGTALNTNYNIIVASHYSTHPNLMTDLEKNTEHNYTVVNQGMIAYNNRSSVTFGSETYNFADKTGKVIIQISGHSHSFGAFKDNGIVWSTTGSPSPEVTARVYDDTDYETMGSRTYGDITEAHFNVFSITPTKVKIISFGQMGDLDFDI